MKPKNNFYGCGQLFNKTFSAIAALMGCGEAEQPHHEVENLTALAIALASEVKPWFHINLMK